VVPAWLAYYRVAAAVWWQSLCSCWLIHFILCVCVCFTCVFAVSQKQSAVVAVASFQRKVVTGFRFGWSLFSFVSVSSLSRKRGLKVHLLSCDASGHQLGPP